jgi:WD40 repeat protein
MNRRALSGLLILMTCLVWTPAFATQETTFEKVWDLEGHRQFAWCVSFSPDGKAIASANRDGTVTTWDMATGKLGRTFSGHSGVVRGVTFAPGGKYVVSSGEDGTVRRWDLATGKQDKLVPVPDHLEYKSTSNLVGSLAFSPDGSVLAAGLQTRVALLRGSSLQDLERIALLADGQSNVQTNVESVAFSRDGKKLAAVGGWHHIIVWDFKTRKELLALKFPHGNEPVDCVMFSSDGKLLASGGHDGMARLWDANTGKELRAFTVGEKDVRSVALHPSANIIMAAPEVGIVKMWRTDTGAEVHFQGSVVGSRFALSADGAHLACSTFSNSVPVVQVWRVSTKTSTEGK